MTYSKNSSIKLHYVLVLFTVIAVTHSAPLTTDNEAAIENYEYTNDGSGNYDYRFKTSNGITRQETGTLVDAGLPNEHIAVKGSYSFNDLEGQLVVVNYVADDKGYNIVSDAPPKYSFSSPGEIARLLG